MIQSKYHTEEAVGTASYICMSDVPNIYVKKWIIYGYIVFYSTY